jgi:hypothetical protein
LGMAALVFDFILFAKMTLLGAQRSGANQWAKQKKIFEHLLLLVLLLGAPQNKKMKRVGESRTNFIGGGAERVEAKPQKRNFFI